MAKNKIAPDPETKEVVPVKTDMSASMIHEVNELHKKFVAAMKKSAQHAFKAGELLFSIRVNADASLPWTQFVKDNFDFSYNTANNYIRTFEYFKEDPALLEDKSITEAYALAGLAGVRTPKEDGGKNDSVKFSGDDRQLDLDYDIEALFAEPCLSKVKLKNYRIESFHQTNRLWLVSKTGGHIPVIQLYTTAPAGLPDIEQQELMKNVQIALEKYYERIERYEEKGIISRPGGSDE